MARSGIGNMSGKPAKHDPYAALRLGEFRLYIAARLMLTIALQIQAVVVGLQIYALTKDPLALGLIGLTEVIPALTVSLYAGHISDRNNRRTIVIICLFGMLFCALGLFYFSLPLSGIKSTLPIYLIIFLSGIARGFFNPANFSFFSQIIPSSLYSNAAAWSSTNWQVGAVAGPAIGGLLYGYFGVSTAYMVDIALTCIALFAMFRIAAKPTPVPEAKESLARSLGAGFRYVFSTPIVLGALSLDLFAVLFGGAEALLPIFSEEILHVGPKGLGFLRAAPAIGAVLMALYLAHHPPLKNSGRILLISVAGFGICMILFGISTSFWLSMGVLALSGAFDNVSVVIRTTVIQTMTPDSMRGRVAAVNSMFIGSSNELGAFESGVTAKWLGAVRSVVLGGCMTMGVVAATSMAAPSLRKLDLGEKDSDESDKR
jgi:MFS family permease